MSLLSLKRCCNDMPKFIFIYENNKVIIICDIHSDNLEYKTGVKKILDFNTKKEILLEKI